MADEEDHPERTVFQPANRPSQSPLPERPAPEEWPQPPAQSAPAPATSPWPDAREDATRRTTAHAMVGTTLNHIYRVDRFIAAGGMGAVYEGANINTDERVAIKIILPHLAADLDIQTLFRNEARTLTQLAHPGLAAYRVLAQEPQLGIFYIVTEFIDGPSLADVLESTSAGADDIRALALRLASGLAVAHDMGKIHRDISPDNILLPGGQLVKAKIIDFGIAKDLSANNKTVIGGGFAGKFGYVAPEQFGDPHDIGPWTDIYSLGLVLLAVALHRAPPMGGTIASAMDARQSVPDLSALPETLRPVMAGMLEPDFRKRFQSMHEVVEAFEHGVAARPAPPPPSPPPSPPPPVRRGAGLPPVLWWLGGGIAAALLFLAAMFFWPVERGGSGPGAVATGDVASSTPIAVSASAMEILRQAAEARSAALSCGWIDPAYPERDGDGIKVKLSGVAPADAGAVAALKTDIAAAAKARVAADEAGLFRLHDTRLCPLLDAMRPLREESSKVGRAIALKQDEFHLQPEPKGCAAKGIRQAQIVFDLQPGAGDFSLFALDGNAGMQQLLPNRAAFDAARAANPELAADIGNGTYRFTFCADENAARGSPDGLAGLLLVKGQGPFDNMGLNPDATDSRPVGAQRLARFVEQGRAKGWTTQMGWYRILDN